MPMDWLDFGMHILILTFKTTPNILFGINCWIHKKFLCCCNITTYIDVHNLQPMYLRYF